MTGETRRTRGAQVAIAACAAVATLLLLPAAAQAIEIVKLSGGYRGDSGELVTQAGAHPNFLVEFETSQSPFENFKDVRADLPPGLVIDPSVTPRCSRADLQGPESNPICSPASQVGVIELDQFIFKAKYPIYNVEPAPGVPATFGVNIGSVVVYLNGGVRSDDFGISSFTLDSSQTLKVRGVKVELWGVPGAASHDGARTCVTGTPCPSLMVPRPMISLPSNCDGAAGLTRMTMDSWQRPGVYATASFDHDGGNPLIVTGCEKVRFEPRLSVRPQSTQADSPTGMEVVLEVPQRMDPASVATATLQRATVTLPAGVAVNPSSAAGLEACTTAQIGLGTDSAPACPAASTVASVSIDTPLLEEDLTGNVYLAKQGANPFGSTLAMYLVAKGPGVTIKLPGKVSPDPQSGRLETTFANTPQLPFNLMTLRFRGGPQAPLVNPPNCGTYVTEGEFVPWSAYDKSRPTADELRRDSDSFAITTGPDGRPCPAGAFAPRMTAGSVNPQGGAFSPFSFQLRREDGSARFSGISVTTPKGLLGRLAGTPYCPDSVIAAISRAEGAGAAEVGQPACPAASQIGTVAVAAGAGEQPVEVRTGRLYLGGPHGGGSLSLVVVMPAIAGPFDLGNVVVRNAVRIDPTSAQLTVTSDPLPTMLSGIPLNVREIRLEVDKPKFMLNPTSCDETAVAGTATAVTGATAPLSTRFQVLGCAALGFKPKLALRLSGGRNRRGGFPALKATLTMPQGNANIARAQVTLPKTQFLEQSHIRTICTRVQYASNSCPKASIYGYARAWSPLLDKPLQGPVYLRSSNHELPDLVASLDGQIHIDLAGRIDSVDERLRSTFQLVPDAPVSKFVLTMQGGRKGLLVNNTNLCKAKPRADVSFDGHNGKASDSRPLVKVAGCAKRKGK